MTMSRPQQLSLQVMLDDSATFDNFHVTPANAQVFDYLGDVEELAQFTFLWGATGAGCSHLLQALCHRCDEETGGTFYFPLQLHAQFPVEILEGLEALSLVCLDGIEQIVGQPAWELALFSLFNRLRDSGTRLLVAGKSAPRQLQVHLPDLMSRLQLGIVFQVHELSDEEKIQAMQKRARIRGMELSEDVAHYVLQRAERSSSGLFELLERLDEHSLQRQRKITIPLVRELLSVAPPTTQNGTL